MRLLFPLSAAIIALSVSTAGAAPCGPHRHHNCTPPQSAGQNGDTGVDLTALPSISKKIVADEPAAPAAQPKNPDGNKDAAPYTGPTIGIAPLPRAPTVGYHWSLD